MIQTLFGSVQEEPGLVERLKRGIEKTRSGLVSRLEDVLAGEKKIDADLLEELEHTLIGADIGVRTATEILDRIRQQVDRKALDNAGEMRSLIRGHLLEVLRAAGKPVPRVAEPPAVDDHEPIVVCPGARPGGSDAATWRLSSSAPPH